MSNNLLFAALLFLLEGGGDKILTNRISDKSSVSPFWNQPKSFQQSISAAVIADKKPTDPVSLLELTAIISHFIAD